MMGMWGGDVNDVDIGVFGEVLVGPISRCRRGAFAGFEELFGTGGRGGGGRRGDGVFYVGDGAGGGIDH